MTEVQILECIINWSLQPMNRYYKSEGNRNSLGMLSKKRKVAPVESLLLSHAAAAAENTQ